jgi:hypothetical protein
LAKGATTGVEVEEEPPPPQAVINKTQPTKMNVRTLNIECFLKDCIFNLSKICQALGLGENPMQGLPSEFIT